MGRYRPLALAVALRESGDLELAEDAAQEALAIAWEKLGELRNPARFRGWLCGIVRNVLRYRARHRRRHAPDAVTPAELAEVAAALPSPLERLIERQRCGVIESELEGLSERYRVPLLLFYGEQLSVREVATVLGLREETVRQRLARGRRKLRERVPREQLAAAPWIAAGTEPGGTTGAGTGSGQGLTATLAAAGGGGKGAAVFCGVAALVALVALIERAPAARPAGSPPPEPTRVTSVAPAGAVALVAAEPALEPGAAPRATGATRATVEMGEPEVRRRDIGTATVGGRPSRPTLLRPEQEPARPELGPLVIEPPGSRARLPLGE